MEDFIRSRMRNRQHNRGSPADEISAFSHPQHTLITSLMRVCVCQILQYEFSIIVEDPFPGLMMCSSRRGGARPD